ncbi:MAG: ribokinase [SAR202 cluster bacterium]|nr:ribokinase [SAR202 cluster bacterium]
MGTTFVTIGHVTKDITPTGTQVGGPGLYSAMTIAKLGHSVSLITRIGRDYSIGSVDSLIDMIDLEADVTTTFQNEETDLGRQQTIIDVAPPISTAEIPWELLDSPVVLLAPVAGEIEPNFTAKFPKSLVGAGIQGWLRRWDTTGKVRARSPKEAIGALPPLGAVFVSAEDWSGSIADMEEVAAASPILVVTQSAAGARMKLGDSWHEIPPTKVNSVDPTGAGDVYAASFLVRLYETRDPLESAHFAACAAALSIEGIGVTRIPTREQIENKRNGEPAKS